jgi:hypothetical protein
VGNGRVILIPALAVNVTGQQRSQIAASLSAAIRNTLLTEAEGASLDRIEDVALPGIAEARTRMDDAEAKLDELEAELDTARNEYRGLDRYRRILWQEGKYGFELPVRDALALLGATGYSQPDEPAIFNLGGETVLVEAESSPGEVGMEPHYRLRERIEGRISKDKRRAYGLIVVNGHNQVAPDERERQYTDPLRIAAESMRYCVVTATDLFYAVRDKLEAKGDAKTFLKRLVETEGIFTPAEPEAEAEPAAAETSASD